MSKAKHALFEAVLARMSLGAVPMDGVYWFDPKAARAARERAGSDQAGGVSGIQAAPVANEKLSQPAGTGER
jgi:hypothetical protein